MEDKLDIMKEVIWLNHIVADYGNGHELNDYNLTVFKGEIVFVYGLHGSGKRVIQAAILGEISVSEGDIYINEELQKDYTTEMALKKGICALNAKKRLIPGLSIAENLFAIKSKKHMLAPFNKKAAIHQVEYQLKQFEISEIKNKRVDELSFFEEQMICMIKLLVGGAQLVIMNCHELYYKEQEISKLMCIIKLLASDGISFLLISERQNPFMSIANKIQYIHEGTDKFTYSANQWMKNSTLLDKYIIPYLKNIEQHSLLGFVDLGWDISLGFIAYWEMVNDINQHFFDAIYKIEFNRNARIVPENCEYCLIPNFDIKENIYICSKTHASTFSVIKNSLLEFSSKEFSRVTGVSQKKKKVDELNFLEKKLLTAFRCELSRPEYMIFENPFFGLDESECLQIQKYFAHLTSCDIKVILFTNSYQELDLLCMEVVVTNSGRLVISKNDTFS